MEVGLQTMVNLRPAYNRTFAAMDMWMQHHEAHLERLKGDLRMLATERCV